MKIRLLPFLLFASSAFAACEQMAPYGLPISPPNAIPLCQIAYAVSFNPNTKTPYYSTEYLIYENISGPEVRRGAFRAHPGVSLNQQANGADYYKSKYDRGHVAAAGNMRQDSVAMAQSFYYTNMVPQTVGLNRGEWSSVEELTRGIVRPGRPLYVISGPLYRNVPIKTIGNGVAVPSHMFKVVYDKTNNKVATYILPNRKNVTGSVLRYRSTIKQVETLSGLVLFPLMDTSTKLNIKQRPIGVGW